MDIVGRRAKWGGGLSRGWGEGFWNTERKKSQKGQIAQVQTGARHTGPITHCRRLLPKPLKGVWPQDQGVFPQNPTSQMLTTSELPTKRQEHVKVYYTLIFSSGHRSLMTWEGPRLERWPSGRQTEFTELLHPWTAVGCASACPGTPSAAAGRWAPRPVRRMLDGVRAALLARPPGASPGQAESPGLSHIAAWSPTALWWQLPLPSEELQWQRTEGEPTARGMALCCTRNTNMCLLTVTLHSTSPTWHHGQPPWQLETQSQPGTGAQGLQGFQTPHRYGTDLTFVPSPPAAQPPQDEGTYIPQTNMGLCSVRHRAHVLT